VDGLGQRLADVRAFLQQRIRALAVKQDETIAAQQRMKEHLDVVGRDVEHTRDEVSEVGAFVVCETFPDESASMVYAVPSGLHYMRQLLPPLHRVLCMISEWICNCQHHRRLADICFPSAWSNIPDRSVCCADARRGA